MNEEQIRTIGMALTRIPGGPEKLAEYALGPGASDIEKLSPEGKEFVQAITQPVTLDQADRAFKKRNPHAVNVSIVAQKTTQEPYATGVPKPQTTEFTQKIDVPVSASAKPDLNKGEFPLQLRDRRTGDILYGDQIDPAFLHAQDADGFPEIDYMKTLERSSGRILNEFMNMPEEQLSHEGRVVRDLFTFTTTGMLPLRGGTFIDVKELGNPLAPELFEETKKRFIKTRVGAQQTGVESLSRPLSFGERETPWWNPWSWIDAMPEGVAAYAFDVINTKITKEFVDDKGEPTKKGRDFVRFEGPTVRVTDTDVAVYRKRLVRWADSGALAQSVDEVNAIPDTRLRAILEQQQQDYTNWDERTFAERANAFTSTIIPYFTAGGVIGVAGKVATKIPAAARMLAAARAATPAVVRAGASTAELGIAAAGTDIGLSELAGRDHGDFIPTALAFAAGDVGFALGGAGFRAIRAPQFKAAVANEVQSALSSLPERFRRTAAYDIAEEAHNAYIWFGKDEAFRGMKARVKDYGVAAEARDRLTKSIFPELRISKPASVTPDEPGLLSELHFGSSADDVSVAAGQPSMALGLGLGDVPGVLAPRKVGKVKLNWAKKINEFTTKTQAGRDLDSRVKQAFELISERDGVRVSLKDRLAKLRDAIPDKKVVTRDVALIKKHLNYARDAVVRELDIAERAMLEAEDRALLSVGETVTSPMRSPADNAKLYLKTQAYYLNHPELRPERQVLDITSYLSEKLSQGESGEAERLFNLYDALAKNGRAASRKTGGNLSSLQAERVTLMGELQAVLTDMGITDTRGRQIAAVYKKAVARSEGAEAARAAKHAKVKMEVEGSIQAKSDVDVQNVDAVRDLFAKRSDHVAYRQLANDYFTLLNHEADMAGIEAMSKGIGDIEPHVRALDNTISAIEKSVRDRATQEIRSIFSQLSKEEKFPRLVSALKEVRGVGTLGKGGTLTGGKGQSFSTLMQFRGRVADASIDRLTDEFKAFKNEVGDFKRIFALGLGLRGDTSIFSVREFIGTLLDREIRGLADVTPAEARVIRAMLREAKPLVELPLRRKALSLQAQVARDLYHTENGFMSVMQMAGISGTIDDAFKAATPDLRRANMKKLEDILHRLAVANDLPPELMDAEDFIAWFQNDRIENLVRFENMPSAMERLSTIDANPRIADDLDAMLGSAIEPSIRAQYKSNAEMYKDLIRKSFDMETSLPGKALRVWLIGPRSGFATNVFAMPEVLKRLGGHLGLRVSEYVSSFRKDRHVVSQNMLKDFGPVMSEAMNAHEYLETSLWQRRSGRRARGRRYEAYKKTLRTMIGKVIDIRYHESVSQYLPEAKAKHEARAAALRKEIETARVGLFGKGKDTVSFEELSDMAQPWVAYFDAMHVLDNNLRRRRGLKEVKTVSSGYISAPSFRAQTGAARNVRTGKMGLPELTISHELSRGEGTHLRADTNYDVVEAATRHMRESVLMPLTAENRALGNTVVQGAYALAPQSQAQAIERMVQGMDDALLMRGKEGLISRSSGLRRLINIGSRGDMLRLVSLKPIIRNQVELVGSGFPAVGARYGVPAMMDLPLHREMKEILRDAGVSVDDDLFLVMGASSIAERLPTEQAASWRYIEYGMDRVSDIAMRPYEMADSFARTTIAGAISKRLDNAWNNVLAGGSWEDFAKEMRLAAMGNAGDIARYKTLFDAGDITQLRKEMVSNTTARIFVDYGPGGRGYWAAYPEFRILGPYMSYNIGRLNVLMDAIDDIATASRVFDEGAIEGRTSWASFRNAVKTHGTVLARYAMYDAIALGANKTIGLGLLWGTYQAAGSVVGQVTELVRTVSDDIPQIGDGGRVMPPTIGEIGSLMALTYRGMALAWDMTLEELAETKLSKEVRMAVADEVNDMIPIIDKTPIRDIAETIDIKNPNREALEKELKAREDEVRESAFKLGKELNRFSVRTLAGYGLIRDIMETIPNDFTVAIGESGSRTEALVKIMMQTTVGDRVPPSPEARKAGKRSWSAVVAGSPELQQIAKEEGASVSTLLEAVPELYDFVGNPLTVGWKQAQQGRDIGYPHVEDDRTGAFMALPWLEEEKKK